MAWYNALFSFLPGGSLVNGLISLGKGLLGNKRRETKLDAELRSQRVAARARRRRALIKASPWPLRLAAMGAWFAPFVAPAWPGVTIDDTILYVEQVIDGMPDWYINIGLMMYGFLWGGSEWKSLVSQRDDERLAEKEVERDAERQRVTQDMSGGEPKGWDYD
ncbi:MAG TPA: hypothetical protein VKA48_03820 [Gammaproteobacteria bacterium]|nr:hypothetical protein [Gammaproteobacteria bacterium]